MVELSVAPGYHLYASPIPDGYTPLKVTVAAKPAEIGEVVLPPAHPFRVDGLDEQFWVYERTVRLTVPIEFVMNRGEPAGDRTIRLTVTYQACSATDCYPPTLASLELTVSERPEAT